MYPLTEKHHRTGFGDMGKARCHFAGLPAYQGFEAYGSRREQKRLLILENSAHHTILKEPFTFADDVIRFVDRFK